MWGLKTVLMNSNLFSRKPVKNVSKLRKNLKDVRLKMLQKKWFDKDCRLKRHTVRKLANKKHRDPNNLDTRNQYHFALQDYKNTLKIKKENFNKEKLAELERTSNEGPNSFWKMFKNMDDAITDDLNAKPISEEQWLTHFEKLHSKQNLTPAQNHVLQELETEEQKTSENYILNRPISEIEIRDAAKKLKRNKSAYSDRIKNEMIRCSINALLSAYVKLFNLVLKTGIFPSEWCEGLITPIFKSDNKLDCNNYRGISVSSCLGKFFCIILNERLYTFISDNNTLHPSQIGFLPGHRTADHILTLKALIDKNVQNKTGGKYMRVLRI